MTTTHISRTNRLFATFPVLLITLLLNSCASLITDMVIEPAVGNLQKQTDVELVCEGAASYLLMIDSLIESDPGDRDLLLIGIKSYGGTVAALDSCGASPVRIEALASKAKKYGKRLLSSFLALDNLQSPAFDTALEELSPADAGYLFWGSFGWLTWVSQQHGSPAAMADLVTIEKLLGRVLQIDEKVEKGSAHLFFGVLYGAKPEMIGGNPDRSRFHFERALELSGRSRLIVQTSYAETYARMTFNKQLHDTLLHEVVAFELDKAPTERLANEIAKRKAALLLEENFFGD